MKSLGSSLVARWEKDLAYQCREEKGLPLLVLDATEQSPLDCSHHCSASLEGRYPGRCGCNQEEAAKKQGAILQCMVLLLVWQHGAMLWIWAGPAGNLPVGLGIFYSVPHSLFLQFRDGAAGVGTGYLGCAVCLATECHGHGWLVRPTNCCLYVCVS